MLDLARSPPSRFCRWPRLAWILQVPRRLEEASGGGSTDRSRRARAQPARRRSRHPAGQPRRVHRSVRLGQVQPRVRHDLRGGPAAVRRVAVGLRAAVPRPDGQAGCRFHRRSLPGRLDRPEVHQPQPALHRRHDHRGLRLPAAPLRQGGRAALPGVRARDREADPAADRRPGAGDGGGFALPGARAGRAHPQGGVRRPVRQPAGAGLLACARRRHGPPAHRPTEAQEAGEARHLRGGRPAHGEGQREAAAHRFGGDGTAARRRARRARVRGPAR